MLLLIFVIYHYYCYKFIIPLLRHFIIYSQENGNTMWCPGLTRVELSKYGQNGSEFSLLLGTRHFVIQSKDDAFLKTLLIPSKIEAKYHLFCSGTITLLFDGLTYNTRGHFAHSSYFPSPLRGLEKYHATRKISSRIIC